MFCVAPLPPRATAPPVLLEGAYPRDGIDATR
jgi:hypothetical protein